MDDYPAITRPEDSVLVAIAEQSLMRRKLLKQGRWLCDELKIALRELDDLMQSAELRFEECAGDKPTIIVRPSRTQAGNLGKSVEAYSLKMMARSLRNPGNMILSVTLEPRCLQARKALIEALFRLYELVTNEKELALAKQGRSQPPSPATSHHRQADADNKTPWGFAAKRRAPSTSERRERLRQQAMQLGKVRNLLEQRPDVFKQILDRVFAEVEGFDLPAEAVTGKILNLVYAESGGAPDAPTAAHPSPAALTPESGPQDSTPEPPRPNPPAPTPEFTPEPSRLESVDPSSPGPAGESKPQISEREAAATPAPSPPTKPRQAPPTSAADIPERFGGWAAQGLAGNQLFRQIKNLGDLEPLIIQWKKEGKARSTEVEQAFVSYFLQQVSRFSIDGQAFSFELPESAEPLDFSGFEILIEQGKEAGAYGIDRRIWGIVGTAFLFLKNAFAPLVAS